MIDRHWQLRKELYNTLHNWPVMAAFFLLGSALGWLAGYLWPSYTKATRDVYVALNPYRAYSDVRFLALAKPRYSNIDNYHYWQMYQLETAIYRDPLVKAALEKLRQEDPYWNNVQASELRRMLDASWRTAGRWKLTAAHSDPQRAVQAARAWSELAAESVSKAVRAAQETMTIDQQLVQANQARLEAGLRVTALEKAVAALDDWQAEAAKLPADQPLPAQVRWRAYSLTTAYARSDPAWHAFLNAQPSANAPAALYRAWIEQGSGRLQADLDVLPARVAALDARIENLAASYQAADEQSLAISPNVRIEGYGDIRIEVVRPTARLALIGGFIGLLAWLLYRLVRAAHPELDRG